MLEERKEKLIRYIYPNEKLRQFLCEDFYDELSKLLPKSKCLYVNSIGHLKRKEEMSSAKETIKNFLNSHQDYADKLKSLYKKDSLDEVVDIVIIGYVFYLTALRDNYRNIDIFRDKRSICYSPISIIDIL